MLKSLNLYDFSCLNNLKNQFPKTRLNLFLSLSIFLPFYSTAAEFPVQPTINAVTIYVNQAVLTKQVSVQVSEGEHQIILDNMPADIAPESIKIQQEWINSQSNVQPRLLDFNLRAHRYPETESIKSLRSRIAKLQQSLQLERLETDRIEARIEFIESYLTQAATQPANTSRLTRDDLEIVAQLTEELKQLKISLLNRAPDIGDRPESIELDKLETELNEALIRFTKQQNQLVLDYDIPAQGELKLEINYAVNSVGWYPLYEVRLDGDKQTLSYFATVKQNTGEDWNNVNVRLSTTAKEQMQPYPLSPRLLDVYQPSAYRSAPSPIAADSMKLAGEMMEAGVAAESGIDESESFMGISTIDTQGVNLLFNINEPVTIVGHNGSRRVLIQEIPLNNTLTREVTPQHSTDVALFSKGKNESSYPWLEGQTNIFIDNQFVRSTSMNTTLPNEEINLFLGNDPNVIVQRSAPFRFKEISRGKNVITESTKTVVKNLNQKTIELLVHESVPSSTNEKITIKMLTLPDWLKPFDSMFAKESIAQNQGDGQDDVNQAGEQNNMPEMTLEQSRGLMRGALVVEPQTEMSYEIKYQVSYPKKENLVGF